MCFAVYERWFRGLPSGRRGLGWNVARASMAIRSADLFEGKLYCALKLSIRKLARTAVARAVQASRMTMAIVVGFVALFG